MKVWTAKQSLHDLGEAFNEETEQGYLYYISVLVTRQTRASVSNTFHEDQSTRHTCPEWKRSTSAVKQKMGASLLRLRYVRTAAGSILHARI